MEEMRNAYIILVGKPFRKGLGAIGIDGRVI
jgi:hypothetical protein